MATVAIPGGNPSSLTDAGGSFFGASSLSSSRTLRTHSPRIA